MQAVVLPYYVLPSPISGLVRWWWFSRQYGGAIRRRYACFASFINPLANLKEYILPAVVLGMGLAGITMRMTRTMMLEVLRQDYVRTAWAKGLRERVVVMRHALKNALIPVITIIGGQIAVLLGGDVIIEQIFNLPGTGPSYAGLYLT